MLSITPNIAVVAPIPRVSVRSTTVVNAGALRRRRNEFVLKFWREPYEMTLFPDGRAIIKGTTDTGVARSLYARFVGS